MMAFGPGVDGCEECERLLQPFLDRELNEEERAEAQRHLDGCSYCAKRFRFEVELRRFVRQAAVEEMTPQLKERLAALRTPLV
jgi:anti-sigma factor (TIGR02949 family)